MSDRVIAERAPAGAPAPGHGCGGAARPAPPRCPRLARRTLRAGRVGLTLAVAACGPEPDGRAPSGVAVPAPLRIAVDSAAIARDRLDRSWWDAAERDRAGRAVAVRGHGAAALGPRPDPLPRLIAAGATAAEAFADISPRAVNRPPRLPVPRRAAGPSALHVQILLDRVGFSPGEIDGRWGRNTEKAVYWFQFSRGLPPTGIVDSATYAALAGVADDTLVLAVYRVRRDDVDGPFTAVPDGIYAMAGLECLCYDSPRELLGERFHSAPAVLERLNPGVDLRRVAAGTELVVPAVHGEVARDVGPIERIVISKDGFYTHAVDERGRIVHHFPSTLGSRYSPSPAGDWRVTGIVPRPVFHFAPRLFHDVPDTLPDAHLPPGPNSPIGIIWMQLSKPHYGIHGTGSPQTIGYATSHGCIRLTNWDARLLAERIERGIRVRFR